MATCPKFGTRGRGVSVGTAVGGRVAVGGTGVKVNVAVAEGTGDAMLGGAEVVQAGSKTKSKIQKPKRFIQAFRKNKSILEYYRLNGYKIT